MNILASWRRARKLPGGTRLFSLALGRRIPYTGTLRPQVLELDEGVATVAMRDRRAVRNHLDSIHAVALTNLGELAGGLAMHTALPPSVRGIVTGLSTEYLKKARGRLVARSRCRVPDVTARTEVAVLAEVSDEDGDVVARVTATWLLDLRPSHE